MIQSMTGFGSASGREFTIEIRSLNHRFVDISMKIPGFMSKHEFRLRNMLKEKFQRGRFDVAVTSAPGREKSLVVDKDLARELYASLKDLQKELSLYGEITLETMAGFKEILVEKEPQYDIEVLFEIFGKAIVALEEMRAAEGTLLVADLRQRIDSLKEKIEKIKTQAPDEIRLWQQKFTERMKLLSDAGLFDSSRILQEAAVMAEKLDIAEEIDRTNNHLCQFTDVLDSDGAVGKKLDFLLQELNREVNTLGSKSANYMISQVVVEMKIEVEKIREQVQNLQ